MSTGMSERVMKLTLDGGAPHDARPPRICAVAHVRSVLDQKTRLVLWFPGGNE